jgi:two-component system, LytTR family, sensor kinase
MSDRPPPAAVDPSPPAQDTRTRNRVWWISFWAFWTTFGILLAAPRVLFYRESAGPATWEEALRIAVLDMYSWSLVALAAVWLSRRIAIGRGEWARAVVLHVLAGLAVLMIRFWGANALGVLVGWIPSLPEPSVFLHILPFNLLFHFSLVGVGYAIEFYRRYRDRELQASQLALETSRLELAASALETRLVEAQLQALKSQIQPHFLFNTLNAISTLVHHDPDRADRMISCLGDLLRTTLAHRQQQEVTVQEELELLGPYLEIEQTRFGDRLTIEIQSQSETLDARVPHLILQPLIENAIRHGIAPQRGPGWISVTTVRRGDSLVVQVRDNGQGLTRKDPLNTAGLGLANIRARLEQLYGSRAALRIQPRPEGGTLVELQMPYQQAPLLAAVEA